MKKTIMYAAVMCAVLAGAVFMVGCKSLGPASESNIAGTWALIEMTKGNSVIKIPSETDVSISFDDSKGDVLVSGFAGVNNFSSGAKISGNSISMGTLATTMMAGKLEDEDVERNVLNFLNNVASFSVSGNTLKLTAKNGEVMTLQRISLVNTAWILSAYNKKNAVTSISMAFEPPMLEFAGDGSISGSTGVNNLIGSYTIKEGKSDIAFSNIGMTRMAARNAEIAELEQDFIALLDKVAAYRISGKILTLADANDSTLLIFIKK